MKKAQIIVLAVVLALMVFSTGCGISDKIGEKIGETIIENATSGQADVDLDTDDGGVTITTSEGTVKTGTDLDWPTDYMGDLPEVKATFVSVITNNDSMGGNVTFEKMSSDDMAAYLETIKSLGYTTDSMDSKMEDGGMYSGKNSAGAAVFYIYNTDGTGSLTYTAPEANTGE